MAAYNKFEDFVEQRDQLGRIVRTVSKKEIKNKRPKE